MDRFVEMPAQNLCQLLRPSSRDLHCLADMSQKNLRSLNSVSMPEEKVPGVRRAYLVRD